MALPVSPNAISLGQVNTELGISPSTTEISLNQAAVRSLFAISSGAIAMSDGHGKSAYTPYLNTDKFGKSTKKPIFELLRTKNKLMKGFSLYFMVLDKLVLNLLFLSMIRVIFLWLFSTSLQIKHIFSSPGT